MMAGEPVMVSSDEANGSTYSGKLDMGKSVLMVKPEIRRPVPMGLARGDWTVTPAMVVGRV
jgi:hypothetical protein